MNSRDGKHDDVKDYHQENEHTYAVEEGRLNELLDVLWPEKGLLEINDTGFVLLNSNVKRSVHLFSSKTADGYKDRMKLAMKSGGITGTHDTKKFIGEVKYERIEKKYVDTQETLLALNGFGPLISSLLKERATLHYNSYYFDLMVNVDMVIGFDPSDPLNHGEAVYHVEFESGAAENIETVCNSLFFESGVSGLVRQMHYEDMKWVLARRFCPEGYTLNFEEEGQLADYYNRIMKVLGPPKMPLLGLDQ